MIYSRMDLRFGIKPNSHPHRGRASPAMLAQNKLGAPWLNRTALPDLRGRRIADNAYGAIGARGDARNPNTDLQDQGFSS